MDYEVYELEQEGALKFGISNNHRSFDGDKNIASAPMVATRPISSGSEIRLVSAILQAMKRLR